MNDSAILLDGVTKHFGSVQALRGVDSDVPRGEMFGFLGPNSAGKTSAIRVLMGFISADAGIARVLGFDVGRESVEIKRHLGFLPDTISFGRGLTGETFLAHIGRRHGIRGVPPMQRELLDRLELSASALKRGVKGDSTGMGKKLALVQAMQHDPELLILDEPTESLDPRMRQQLFGSISAYVDRAAHRLVRRVVGPVRDQRHHRLHVQGAGWDGSDRGLFRTVTRRYQGHPPRAGRVCD